MAVELTFQRVSPERLRHVTANQDAWEQFRTSDWLGLTREELVRMATNPTPENKAKFKAVLEKRNADERRLDISKDWHVLYYLLTGSAKMEEEHREGQPLHNVIFGGITTSVKAGCGAVRYFDNSLINEIVAALEIISEQQLMERFVPEQMLRLQIYAAPQDYKEGQIIFRVFERLRTFFRQAVRENEFVIVYGH